MSSEFWDLRRYELELERVRVLAMRAAGLESGIEEIAALEANLARVPAGRVDELVHRFNLGSDEVSFMWTVIAAGYDPETGYALERLGGGDSRGGASFALHTALHQMDAARARKLVRSMTASHPLFKAALLVAADSSADSASVRVWRCAPRFALYVAGSNDIDHAIASVGGFLLPPDKVIPRKDQAATVELLEQLLRTDSVIMLEGPAGVGRRTLAAIAASSMGRPLVHVISHGVTCLKRASRL